MTTTPTPWKRSLPDETLVLGRDGEDVATTFISRESYDENYERHEADAELIVIAVNAHGKAFKALRQAYTTLAFAFNRLHESSRSRDGELCADFQKVRAEIETVFRDAGIKL